MAGTLATGTDMTVGRCLPRRSASHLGELLTRATPRPAPPRDALVQQAAARADLTKAGQEEPGQHPLNDLQKSILAAAHQLRADGHPPNTP